MKYASVLTLLLWAAPVWADPPVAKLSGPAAVKVGDPIILNPTGSVAPGGLEFGVAVGPGPVPIVTLKSDDGKTVIGFGTAAASGGYTLYVIAWGLPVPNGKTEHAFAFWPVTVGDVLPPAPLPPSPSDGVLGLTKASREGAAKVTPAVRSAQAARLAAAHRDVVRDLSTSSLNWPTDSFGLADAVTTARRTKNKVAVDSAAWAPWSASVDPVLESLYRAGRLKTIAEWQAALNEIASGLES